MKITNRDKAILIGLYLSKFDKEGLKKLGFSRFSEAFTTLSLSVEIKPASIKNYRDEFDPFFSNPRKGWHKRKLREYCKIYYENYKDLNIHDFTNLVKRFVFKDYDLEELISNTLYNNKNEQTFAKRLITGNAAENYFKTIYQNIPIFQNLELIDTTQMGCGFDFKLSSSDLNFYYGVEVKGMSGKTGNILLTEKEFKVANYLKDNYFLFVVKNFIDKPTHVFYQNPLLCNLNFKKMERKITQISYSTII